MSQGYNFYQLERTNQSEMDFERVYPFSHTYGPNIGIRVSPREQRFLSVGASQIRGVADKDVTLRQYFGIDTPEVRPLNFLLLDGEILGVRFTAVPEQSAFVFDVALECLTEGVIAKMRGRIPMEEMTLDDSGNYTTHLESQFKIYICDATECNRITEYINAKYGRD